MKVLVTGGGGFIGSNLVRALLEQDADVVVLDNFSTGRRGNLGGIDGDVRLVEGDLRSYERVHAATSGCEIAFHQGALPSVPRSVQDPLTTNAVNVDGTLNVLLAARDEGVRRVVFASSSSVYGNAPGFPRKETQPVQPIAPYPVAKLAAESYCRAFWDTYGLETVCLRYFNVFGPRQDPASEYAAAVPRFISKLMAGEQPVIYGTGEQSRDFTFVGNVVTANLLAAAVPGIGGRVYNVATGESRTVNELAASLQEILGTSLEPSYAKARVGDVKLSAADIELARTELGYEPEYSFDDGLRTTADFLAESLV
jgi:nucleoside-diphosphate-sugar epimerase